LKKLRAIYIANNLEHWNITKEAAANIYSPKAGSVLIKDIISNILPLVLVQAAVDGN
jgi:hypothetical protein